MAPFNISSRFCSIRLTISSICRCIFSSIPENSCSLNASCNCPPFSMTGCAFCVQISSVFLRSPSTALLSRYPSFTSRSTCTDTRFALIFRTSTISLAVLYSGLFARNIRISNAVCGRFNSWHNSLHVLLYASDIFRANSNPIFMR